MHYPANFNSNELKDLSLELHIYIDNVWADAVFAQLDTISELVVHGGIVLGTIYEWLRQ